MQFAQPIWLVAGAAACALLVWQYRRFDLAQRAALAQFAAARLLGKLTSSVSPHRRGLKRALFTIGTMLVFVALARPQVGFEWQETHRKGLELLFAVDTSKSMLAQDVKPDRLTRAKMGVTDLVAKLNGDGVGLVAFAGNAFLQCPVTLDYDAFRESLDSLDVNVIPRGGTNIAAAIRESEAVFKTRTAAEKILVLITDGEDLDGEGVTAAQAVAKNGVKIFTVGVGSATGELVPVPGENGGTEFAKDDNGEFVKSHLDEATLKKIAEVTGGLYQPLGAQGEGLAAIYEQGLANFTRDDLSSRQAKVPLEKFHWALFAALACFIAEHLIGNRRRFTKTAPMPVAKKAPSNLRPAAATAALVLIGSIASTQAATPQGAEQAYQQGDFAKSQQEYAATASKQPAKAELQFNSGSAAYKAGDYAQAAAGFQQSLKTEQVPVQQGAYYNLGNTQYRLGRKTEKENPQETIKTWEEAVKSYDAALQIKADDAEAKHNRDFVQRKIDQLKKQEEQKKQDQQKQQDQKDQQQKQDQKDQSQDQKNDSKDQQQNQDQKNDSKDQKDESKDQQKDSKDQSGDSKDQKAGDQDQQKDSKDQSGDSKDQKDDARDPQNGDEKKNEPKDSKGEEPKKDEPKDQKADGQPQPGDNKKDQPQADAKSGKGEQPKPVDPAKQPSKGEAQSANGEKPEDAQAAAEAAAENERGEPGQMTKAEAKHLLDALKGDERKAPAISAQGRAAGQPNDHKKLKDW
jgi:Ca-activated chloride channel family protein